MFKVLIELSNKTTEVMARNLVRAFANHGIVPFVFKIEENDGTLRSISGSPGIINLNTLSDIFPDSHRPLIRGYVGDKLLRALLSTWDKEKIDAIILFNEDSGHRKVIAEWGRITRVPVFFVPEHGGALKGAIPRIYKTPKQRVATKLEQLLFPRSCWTPAPGKTAEYVCAPNEKFKTWLESSSQRHQISIVTGSPLYDDAIIRAIPIKAPNYDVLFVHQPLLTRSNRYREFLRAFVEIGVYDERFKLIIKAHPRSSANELELIYKLCELNIPFNKHISIVTTGDVRDTLSQSGAVVVACSTALNDALLGGIPVIILKRAFGNGFDAYADEYGAALAVNQPEDLGLAVKNALLDDKTRIALHEAVANQTIHGYFGGLDRKPSEKIVSFVLETLMKK